MKDNNSEKKNGKLKNITINLPEIYIKNIQKLIDHKVIASRSEAIRTALRDFLNKEYSKNLELFGYFDKIKGK